MTVMTSRSDSTPKADEPCCNFCGGTGFQDMNGRPKVRCEGCGSLERTRILLEVLKAALTIRPGLSILHIAPEECLTRFFKALPAVDYQAVDLCPELYLHTRVRRMDLVSEAEQLPTGRYDLILHSHVMEHVPSNVSSILLHLHRALKPDGLQIFAIPIFRGSYEECLGDIGDAERSRRFHQNDHVRRFGADDILLTLGKLFQIQEAYDLHAQFPQIDLARINVPASAAKGYSSNSVFCLRKKDCHFVFD